MKLAEIQEESLDGFLVLPFRDTKIVMIRIVIYICICVMEIMGIYNHDYIL